MNNTQSRPGTTTLVSLAITLSMSVGCSNSTDGHPTAVSASSTSGTISTTAGLVDVEKVWETEPLPDCPKPPIVYNGPVPAGLELPSKSSVSEQLAGVKSPGAEGWVREKLGWVTQELAATRAGILDHPESPSVHATNTRFGQYVVHVRSELQAGQDISDPSLDGRFPEGCA